MGEYVTEGEDLFYRQEDGQITARLTAFEEKMELAHRRDPKYQRIFYLLVAVGLIYLGGVFVWY